MNSVTVHVIIIDEDEFGTARPTQAIPIGNDLYQLLPIEDYHSADETWEFPPGSIVKVVKKRYEGKSYLLAVKPE